MIAKLEAALTQKRRAYIYRILIGVGALLVARRVVAGDEWPLWASIAEAVLLPGAAGLAAANTPTKNQEP